MTIDDFMNQKESDTITGHYGLDEDTTFEKIEYLIKTTTGNTKVSSVIDACKAVADSQDEAMVLMHTLYMARFQMMMDTAIEDILKSVIRGMSDLDE